MEAEVETEDREEIIEVLQEIEQGDELTIETEETWEDDGFESYKDHREILFVEERPNLAQFGDPMKSGKIIDLDTAEIGNLPETAEKMPTWIEISKLWRW